MTLLYAKQRLACQGFRLADLQALQARLVRLELGRLGLPERLVLGLARLAQLELVQLGQLVA